MDMTQILEKMIMLFLILGIGFFAGKTGMIDERANKVLSMMVADIAAPCLVLHSSFIESETVTKGNAILALVLSTAIYFALMLLAKAVPPLLGIRGKDKGVIEYMVVFSNNGFMGFPVIQAVFGDEALIYASVINLSMNVLVFSYGSYLMAKSGSGEGHRRSVKELLNPGILSALLALLFYLLGVRLPDVFVMTFDTVGGMTTPLAMIVIGASLSSVSMKETFRDFRVYVFSAIRLMLLPFLAWLVMSRFLDNWLLLGVLVVITGMPCATMSVIQAGQEGANATLASRYVFVTTLLSMATVPAMAYVLYGMK